MSIFDDIAREYYMRAKEEQFSRSSSPFGSTLTKEQELAVGLTYGDVGNAYAEHGISDRYTRIRMNQTMKKQVVEYMKGRYQFWIGEIKAGRIKA